MESRNLVSLQFVLVWTNRNDQGCIGICQKTWICRVYFFETQWKRGLCSIRLLSMFISLADFICPMRKPKLRALHIRYIRPICFFIKHWRFWVIVFLIENETQFRLHISLSENCYKTLFFSPLLVLFSYQTPHCFKTICPHWVLQCHALLAKKYNIRSSICWIFGTRIFCWLLLIQMKTAFYSDKFPPHRNLLKSKTVTSFPFWLLQVVLSPTKCWKDDVFVRILSWRG